MCETPKANLPSFGIIEESRPWAIARHMMGEQASAGRSTHTVPTVFGPELRGI